MDSDFWTSRLAAAKRQYTFQHHHQSSHLGSYLHIRSGFFLFFIFGFSFFLFVYYFDCIFCLFVGFGLDRLGIDDFEVEDEVRPDFPCPYCYEDFDIVSLCSHLEDEHSCESKVTVRVSLDTHLDLVLFFWQNDVFFVVVYLVWESQNVFFFFLIWFML